MSQRIKPCMWLNGTADKDANSRAMTAMFGMKKFDILEAAQRG